MIVGIKLNGSGRVYYFNSNGYNLKLRDTVIVETEKGLQYGEVVSYIDSKNVDSRINYKNVIRLTTKADYKRYITNLKDAKKAISKCRELVKKYELNMNIIDACYTFDREQLIFRFLSDDRVDFRQLAKDLGAIFKTRIELHQIGIRDKAREVSGIGPCGRKICCNSFLTEFDSVSINMAKNQNLSLNPSKINGVCGRLLCCLKYENENYTECKKSLPEISSKIKIASGEGKVISVDILNRTYKVLLDETEEVKVIDINDSEK